MAKTLWRKLMRALRSWSPFHFKRNTITPDPDLFKGSVRKYFSPMTHASVIAGILFKDETFIDALPRSLENEYLVRLGIVGDCICANVFLVETDYGDLYGPPLRSIYHDDWQNTGIIDYVLAEGSGTYSQVVRTLADHDYCPDDPLVSFMRPLTARELEILSPMVRPLNNVTA